MAEISFWVRLVSFSWYARKGVMFGFRFATIGVGFGIVVFGTLSALVEGVLVVAVSAVLFVIIASSDCITRFARLADFTVSSPLPS